MIKQEILQKLEQGFSIVDDTFRNTDDVTTQVVVY